MLDSYDAIVIGTGISGGWAAKELCEKGLKTLVLERGRMVKHIVDYHTAHMDPWDFKGGDKTTQEIMKKQYKQIRSTKYAIHESTSHFFVNDDEHPYNEDKPFDWVRGYHVGGKSLMWARQVYRLSEIDFEANAKEGIGIDWPIRYKDLAPWYSYVEKYIGVSGEKLGLPQLPDSEFLKPMELNCVEEKFKNDIANKYNDRIITNSRVAHITEGTKPGLGRVTCQYRNRCRRGCPYGAYFSSNSSTLPAAEETGNMTLRPNSIVHQIIYDEKNQIGVPESAVTIQGNTAFVYTVNEDTAEKKNIEIGKRNFGKVSVISGLNEGDLVISEGVSKVRDKGKIKIITSAK